MADLISMLAAAAGAAAGGGEVDPNFNQTVLLLHGDGTDGAQNNTFLDSSTNNFTITRNGNTTQGTFSPFSAPDGRWSNYFDGTNGYLDVADSTDFDFGSGAFTISWWQYRPTNANSSLIDTRVTSGNGWLVTPRSDGTIQFYVNTATKLTGTIVAPLNEWNFIVVVRDASGNISLFVNGVKDVDDTGYTSNVNADSGPRIGAAKTGTLVRITGYVADLSITKGSAVYDPTASTITVPSSPTSTSLASQVLLSCYSNRFIDSNTTTTAKAITVVSGPKVTPFSPFAPTAAYSASVNGGSGYFDGVNDYLAIADDVAFDLSNSAFTIEAWIYMTGGAGANRTIISQLNSSNSGAFLFYVNTSDKLSFFHNPGAVTSLTGATSLNLNEWIHVAVTRSGNDFALYINGTRDDTLTSTVTISASALDVTIGADVSATRDLTGYISSLRWVLGTAIYDPADATITIPTSPLTAVANTSLLLSTTNAGIFDNTGKNNLETVGNAQIDTTTKKYGTGSMEFDGTGDYLIAPITENLVFGSGDVTFECWVYPNTISGTDTIYDTRTVGSYGAESFTVQLSAGIPQVFAGSYSGATPVVAGSAAISASTWTHIAFSRSSGTNNLFVNGTSVGSNSNAWTQTLVSSNRYAIGQTNGIDRPFDGFIDDLRITKGVARYTTTFTPPTKAFPDL